MCHIGQTFMLIGSLQHGSCTIQPSVISFSPDELMAMVRDCGLNRLNQFAAFLATSLRASRKNPKLLATLKNLDEILYSGLPLSRDEEEWAYSNGMNLRVSITSFLEYERMLTAVINRICLAAPSAAR